MSEREMLIEVATTATEDRSEAVRIVDEAYDTESRMVPCASTTTATGEEHGLPMINGNTRAMDQVTAISRLLQLRNLRELAKGGFQPDVVYRSNGDLCRVVRRGSGFIAQTYDSNDLILAAEHVACTIKETKSSIKHTAIPAPVRRGLAASNIVYPELNGVITAPRWTRHADGSMTVADKIGYDPASRMFVAQDFDIRRTKKPTVMDVRDAVVVIEEIIEEFQFADEASRTNAVAMALTMALRSALPTAPAFVISAADPGSGKSLLAEVIHALVYGRTPNARELAYSEAEQTRRNMVATLRDSQDEVIWYDEPRKSTSAEAMILPMLNRVLTAESGELEDRPVFSKHTVRLNVRRTFVLTGNNIVLGAELQRRSVLITLVKDDSVDFSRTEAELYELAISRHAAFHQAVAVLLDNWLAKGCPEGVSLGSFNEWGAVVGGTLRAAGVERLLENEVLAHDDAEDARARMLLWLLAGRRSADISASEITTSLADGIETDDALLQIVVDLATYSGPEERRTWERLFAVLESGTPVSQAEAIWTGRAMTLVGRLATSRTVEGQAVSVRKMARGDGRTTTYRIARHGE